MSKKTVKPTKKALPKKTKPAPKPAGKRDRFGRLPDDTDHEYR
jgi:hypothetical protein